MGKTIIKTEKISSVKALLVNIFFLRKLSFIQVFIFLEMGKIIPKINKCVIR